MIRAAAESTGTALPESFNPPDLEPEDYFPYQCFWHLKHGQDNIAYLSITDYSDRHHYNDPDELVEVVFALDAVFGKHQEKERKKQAAKSKMKGKKHGRR